MAPTQNDPNQFGPQYPGGQPVTGMPAMQPQQPNPYMQNPYSQATPYEQPAPVQVPAQPYPAAPPQPVMQPPAYPDPNLSAMYPGQPPAQPMAQYPGQAASPVPGMPPQPLVAPVYAPQPPVPAGYDPNNQQYYPGPAPGQPLPAYPAQAAAPSSPAGSNRKKIMVIGIAAIAFLFGSIIAVVIATAGGSKSGSSQTAFTDAISKSLSVKSLEESVQRSASTKATIDLSFADNKNPVLSGTIVTAGGSPGITMQSFANLKNNYININKLSVGDPATDKAVAPMLNKWVQTRQDSTDLGNSNLASFGTDVSPESFLLGSWIFGNFSASDRAGLMSYLASSGVYSYDAGKVTKSKLNGSTVYVYDVTIDQSKLAEYNKKVAKLTGISDDHAQNVLGAIGTGTQTAKLYIDSSSHYLVKASLNGDNENASTYGKYNTASVAKEPKADLTSDKFVEQLQGSAATTSTPAP